MFPRFAAAIAFVAVSALPQIAFAQQPTSTDLRVPSLGTIAAVAQVQFADDQSAGQIGREMRSERSWTTPLLTSLQAATIVTQMLDVHSTATALKVGATEANPLMGGLVNNKAAFIGVKAAMGAGLIYATHHIAKDNKMLAIVTSAAINSAYLMIARHNYKVARNLR
jgi:hypothetical protein